MAIGGIPALDFPVMTISDKAVYLNPEDIVFGVTIKGGEQSVSTANIGLA